MRSFGFRKRALLLVALGLIAVPLSMAAVAYACTAVATLSNSPGAASAGSTVTVSGKGFGNHDPSVASSNGPAEIHLGSLSGPVLATASPSGTDKGFSVQMTVPPGTPAGDTFIVATQQQADGRPVFGTPARQAFTVMPSSAAQSPTPSAVASGAASAAPPAAAPQPTSNTGPGTGTTIKNKASHKAARTKATATCKRKYSPSKAKGKKAKTRMAHKRAACVKKASKL